ncbi:response regulator transcription factor [Paenibacillus antibioticophila]|uniref:response regulator transcription factor n=1 Tax=Paenibacillus antibioticophila TaxID=1274374 RepID=UPI0005CB5718|nr:response regulator transcription factor [Paenibacillus antibioticophila]
MHKIFIVEDDSKISNLLHSYMSKYGFEAREAVDFNDVLEEFQDCRADLVLLDINLPKYDGFYWCRQIRTHSNCPILFISARDSQMDQVMALENGADDYITKPFHYEVIMAKIKSQLRRAYGAYASSQEERKLESGELILYPERYIVSYAGHVTELTVKESQLLEALMLKEGRAVSREKLLDLMWEDHHFIDDNTLNVYITRLRKKLKELGSEDRVETVRGVGYKLALRREDLQ